MVNKLRVFVTRIGEANRNVTFTLHVDDHDNEDHTHDIHFTSTTAHDGQVRHRKIVNDLPSGAHTHFVNSRLVPYHVYTKPQGKVSAFIQFIPRHLPYVYLNKPYTKQTLSRILLILLIGNFLVVFSYYYFFGFLKRYKRY